MSVSFLFSRKAVVKLKEEVKQDEGQDYHQLGKADMNNKESSWV